MNIKESKIPLGWKIVSLGEVADVQNGYAFKSEDFSTTGVSIIKIKNIASGRITVDDLDFYPFDIEKLKPFHIKNGDILVSMTGSHIAQLSSAVGKVTKYTLSYTSLLNQRVGKIYPKDNLVDNSFLWYLVSQPSVQIFWGNKSGGSANQANISPDIIKSYEFILPSLQEQKIIATVLSSLEKKIELLLGQIKTLNELAQSIFNEWFLRYNFPGTTGKMVDSELGEIPKGWKFGVLGELGKQRTEKVKEDLERKVLSAVNSGELVLSEEFFNKQVFSKSISKYLKCELGDFAYNPSRINIGSIGRNNIVNKGAVSPVYVVFQPIKLYGRWIEFLIKTNLFKKHVEKFANGSVRQSLNYDGFSKFECIIPSEDILDKFDLVVESIENKIIHNNKQIDVISKLKDLLLPKLVNGDIRVKGFDKS